MANYTILKNTDLFIDLPLDFSNQGWVISANKAYHSGCNSGYIEKIFDLSGATQWSFTYTILSVTTGSINIVVNGVNGVSRTTAGTYTETFTVTGANRLIRFFSTGENALEIVKIYPSNGAITGTTLAFNEDALRFTTYYSYVPEFTNKFINSFFTFKDGGLWEHNVNETRNNFYGEQFTSKVRFICNFEFQKNKLFFNLRLDSKGAWFSPYMKTQITDQFPNGMESRLKKSNFKLIDGKLWGDVLRDLTDPAFAGISNPTTRALEALFKGRKMQGGYMIIELENADTTEAKLSSVEVYYVEAERNF